MDRRLFVMLITCLVAGLGLPLAVRGHSGDDASGIQVEPASITAGGTVVLAGAGLEPDSDREINLVGPDVVVPFSTVTTDMDGMFSVELTIPSHLPGGTYMFQAIGDEVLTTDLTVTAAAGANAPEPPNEAVAVVAARDRPSLELGLVVGLVVLAILGGLLLVVGAERLGGGTRAASDAGEADQPVANNR